MLPASRWLCTKLGVGVGSSHKARLRWNSVPNLPERDPWSWGQTVKSCLQKSSRNKPVSGAEKLICLFSSGQEEVFLLLLVTAVPSSLAPSAWVPAWGGSASVPPFEALLSCISSLHCSLSVSAVASSPLTHSPSLCCFLLACLSELLPGYSPSKDFSVIVSKVDGWMGG